MAAEDLRSQSEPRIRKERDLLGRQPKKHADWSHRRREPRGLALAWTVYLMLATMVSLMPMVAAGQLSTDVYRPAARMMMVLVMVGFALLWPVMRISQRPQRERAVLDVILDLSIMVIPSFVIVWPQVVLAGWPVPVIAALCVVLLVWGLLIGSMLMMWHRFSTGGRLGRAVVAIALIGITGGIPLALLSVGSLDLSRPGPEAVSGWMWSPITSAWEVLRAREFSGLPAAVDQTHWRILWAQLGIVCVVFVVTAWRCRGRMAGEKTGPYAQGEPG